MQGGASKKMQVGCNVKLTNERSSTPLSGQAFPPVTCFLEIPVYIVAFAPCHGDTSVSPGTDTVECYT